MKNILLSLIIIGIVRVGYAQNITIGSGAVIDVSEGADICATSYGNIEGEIIGSGTQCGEADDCTPNYTSEGTYALQFNGIGDYVNVPYSSSLDFGANDFTIEVWVKRSELDTRHNILERNPDALNIITFYIGSDNKVYGTTYEGGNSTGIVSNSTVGTSWTHLAFVRSGTNHILYINGVLDNSSTGTVRNFNVNADINIGRWPGGGNYFNGAMDELRIWNTARMVAEIKLNMYHEICPAIGLKAYYKMNEASGSSLDDYSGNNNTGTLFGSPIWVSSDALVAPPNALSFDGLNDFVTINDNDGTITTAFTIETWLLWNPNASTDIQFICGKGIEQMELHTGGTANALRFIPTTGVYIDAANVLTAGRWSHVAAVYDATNGIAKLYINGAEVPVTKAGPNPIGAALQSTATSFYIGSRSDGSYRLKGSTDEFRVWNRVRSQEEIQTDMLQPIDPAAQTSLVSYYGFNLGSAGGDNSGLTTLVDLAGNHNGYLNNFALTGTTSNWVESYAMVVPTATAATNVKSNGFAANWSAPAVGTIDNYLLEVATDSTFVALVSGYNSKTVAAPNTTSSVTGLATESVYYYRIRADKASVTGQGAWSGFIQVETTQGVPVDLAVSDTTIATGEACFDAENEITVAGSSSVVVENSALANFIAGQTVTFLPGFHAVNGSYVRAWITEDASFCDVAGGSPIIERPIAKSVEKHAEPENRATITGKKTVKVYPNPNNGQFTLELTNFENGATVGIFNMQGAKIYQSTATNETIHKIDLPTIRKGIYFVKVMDGKEQFTKKMVVD